MAGLNLRPKVGARPTGQRTVAGLSTSYLLRWMFCAEGEEGTPWRYVSSNIYWRRSRWAAARVGKTVSLDELLSIKSPRLDRYYRECFRPLAARCGRPSRVLTQPAAHTERDKVIVAHWNLAAKKCREKVPQAHRADAISACMERVILAWEKCKPELGAFTSYAEQAIDWAIQDFLKEQRKQVPVQRSINLNDPAVNANVLKPLNVLQGHANEAKRRRVAECLGCLDQRAKYVIERRLCLNGYREPPKHRELAAELGLSIRTIQRIEETAVRKLQEAVI
jgi:RNA polymerase sigma factor (sigma-70 family)